MVVQKEFKAMNSNNYYTLITGASSGLGKALAIEMAMRGYNLVLAALPETGLESFCKNLREEYDVSVFCFENDMTQKDAPLKLRQYTQDEGLKINILINNLGVGFGGDIGNYSQEQIESMIFMNIWLTTLLTNLYITDLQSYPNAKLLNIGSYGGLIPLPHKSIYSASKSYIFHFSQAIKEELRGSGIHVSVAMPGPMLTNNLVIERINKAGAKAKYTSIEPEKAARLIIKGFLNGRTLIIPGRLYHGFYKISGLMPYSLLKILVRNTFKGIC